MTPPSDRLYELLPAIHRIRDAEQGYSLKALLQVIESQVDVLEDDIAQLYENWFIETALDWVVPYIGDLIGYKPVHAAGESGDPHSAEGRALNNVLIPRRDVANTIRNRRRKGTLALLEELARDAAGWPARAVEFFPLLVGTQALNHRRLDRGRSVDLRDGDALARLGSPFERLAHVVDVRRSESRHRKGRSNLPGVGLFVWRMRSYPVSGTSAYCLEEVGPENFTMSILGNDTPLFQRPSGAGPEGIAQEEDLPLPIRRRALEMDLAANLETEGHSRIYGERASFHIVVGNPLRTIPAEELVAADLTDWRYVARPGTVAVDPELGRISFPPSEAPKDGVWVSYRYGFSDDLGGGDYARPVSQPAGAIIYSVGGEKPVLHSIGEALTRWREDRPQHAVIEIMDSAYYSDPIDVELGPEQSLQLRAAVRTRPVVHLLDRQPGRPDSLRVRGERGSRFTLDGLLISGRPVRAEGNLSTLTIRHCTLVPGWDLRPDCEPSRPSEPSIELQGTTACLVIEHSIVGPIQVAQDAVSADPNPIHIVDSVVDATSDESEAVGGTGWPLAHARLRIARSTLIGRVETHAIEHAENSIFLGEVCVGRRQIGCVRFCYVAPDSRTPRRYRCQPDLVEARVTGPEGELEDRRRRERMRVRPLFDSTRYGTPAYCRLSLRCAEEIRRGADDRSEMGVFHDLFQPQRRANLEARLREYSPAAMDAGIFFAS